MARKRQSGVRKQGSPLRFFEVQVIEVVREVRSLLVESTDKLQAAKLAGRCLLADQRSGVIQSLDVESREFVVNGELVDV
jgi:hypothetical protein